MKKKIKSTTSVDKSGGSADARGARPPPLLQETISGSAVVSGAGHKTRRLTPFCTHATFTRALEHHAGAGERQVITLDPLQPACPVRAGA